VRKRLFIGAIAAVVIGVAAYALSPPKEGSVEWHKRQYLALRYPKVPLKERIEVLWAGVRGRILFKCSIGDGSEPRALLTHVRALEQLGYLRRRVVILTNASPGEAMASLITGAHDAMPDGHIWHVEPAGMDSVLLLYPRKDNKIWEGLIREADVSVTR
jgi:hypothetical protein